MDKISFQSILIHIAIIMGVMMLVWRIDILKKIILGGK